MNLLLPRSSLLTIYKSLVRLHLNYRDAIFDQPNNSRLSEKNEIVKYYAASVIPGTIRGNSKEKLYQELGLKSLKDRGWLRQIPYLYKIILIKLLPFLYELIPSLKRSHWYPGCFQILRFTTILLLTSLLPFPITDSHIKIIDSYAMFRKKLLTFIKPLEKDSCGIYDPLGVRSIKRLRLSLSHLREHKFRHNFVDTLSLLCSCSIETEDTEHYFLRWQNNLSVRTTLMNDLNNINTSTGSLNSNYFLRMILYGKKSLTKKPIARY